MECLTVSVYSYPFTKAVQPSTGAMIFDEFQDTPGCSELETRLQHIGIAELLIPDSLSLHTKNFIKLFASQAIR